MRFVTGNTADLPSTLMIDMAHYRHKIFVEQLGWQLRCESGLEYDQFDRTDTVYVIAQSDDGDVIGTARLLPTTRPYLLQEVFPQLMNELAIPNSEDVWELSRFAAADLNTKTTSALGQFSSEVAVELLEESIRCAAKLGAKKLITVSPLGIERLLRFAGFKVHRAAPPMLIDGLPTCACWIPIEVKMDRK